MAESIDIETQGPHQYVVRMRDGEDACESWFSVTPALLAELGVRDDDEERAVLRTAEFLVERHGVPDFPDIVELEDVIATYGEYVSFMTRSPS